MNGCLNCSDPVDGVGDFSGIMSGIGSWFSSGIGAELLKAGISFGVGYGLHELTSGRSGSQPGNLTGGTTVNPAGSGFIPQAGGQQAQTPVLQSASVMPSWVLPVAVVGGLAVLLLALKK
jgi:hypothetical protein